jgi:hypothetical protein
MVIFDLICANEHSFEGWFANLADLEDQMAKGLIACPVCGDINISRRPSTFGMVKSKSQLKVQEAKETEGEERARLIRQLEQFSDKISADFKDVGAQFSTEALKMHYGAAPRRNIRGLSTQDEEEMLKKEGVEFYKVPMLVRKNTEVS